MPFSYRKGKQVCDYLCKQNNLHWTFTDYSLNKLVCKLIVSIYQLKPITHGATFNFSIRISQKYPQHLQKGSAEYIISSQHSRYASYSIFYGLFLFFLPWFTLIKEFIFCRLPFSVYRIWVLITCECLYVSLVALCTWSWFLHHFVLLLNLCPVIRIYLYKFSPVDQYLCPLFRTSLVVFKSFLKKFHYF